MTKKKVLVIAAHPDDEVVGCGGTLLKLKKKKFDLNIVFVADGVLGKLKKNSDKKIINTKINERENKAKKVAKKLGVKKIFFLKYPDLKLYKSNKQEITSKLISIINITKPDTVFIHSNKDLHPDHRVSNECSITALRPILKKNPTEIFAFEIPSSSVWSFGQFGEFRPNLFFDIEKEIDEKNKLLSIYNTELWKPPHPLSKKYLKQNANVAGAYNNINFSERFECIKILR